MYDDETEGLCPTCNSPTSIVLRPKILWHHGKMVGNVTLPHEVCQSHPDDPDHIFFGPETLAAVDQIKNILTELTEHHAR